MDCMQLAEVERTWRRHIHPPEGSRLKLAQTTSTLPRGITDLLFKYTLQAVILTMEVIHSRSWSLVPYPGKLSDQLPHAGLDYYAL